MVNITIFWKFYYKVNNSITITIIIVTETVAGRRSVKNMFFKTLQNSKENICVGVSFLIKLHASGLQHLFWQNTSIDCFCCY